MVTRVLGNNTGNFLGGGEDARLGSASPTTNYGGATTIQVQNSGEFDKSTVVFRQPLPGEFALSTVTAASIRFYGTDVQGGWDLDIHECTRAWVEAQATGNIWSTGNNWATQLGIGSGDYNATRLARLTIAGGGGFSNDWRTWSDAALLAHFQALADASATEVNLLLRPADLTSTSGPYGVFISTEGTDGQRWEISLTYTPAGGSYSVAVTETIAPADAQTNTRTHAKDQPEAVTAAESTSASISSLPPGTFTSGIFARIGGEENSASTALTYVSVCHPTTGLQLSLRTGLSTSGTGQLVFTDPVMVAGTAYLVHWLEVGGHRGWDVQVAT